ncbi:MAG: helix-turn-helix transcriptional regulator [Clostridia bacterium]|nr:helix-turn-helix transcriptional regulator [Clostridia bacterium]
MGYRVKDVREEMRMTQEELAEKSGVSRATIIAIERDETKDVKASTLLKLAQALGTTVDKLFLLA